MVFISCWSNYCEDTVGWTVDPLFTLAVDSTRKKQGSSSIRFYKPYNSGINARVCSLDITDCDEYLGFWFRPELLADGILEIYVQKTSDSAYAGINVSYNSPTAVSIQLISWAPGLSVYAGPFKAGLNNDWNYIELRFWRSQVVIEWQLNGVWQGALAGYNVRDYDKYRVWGMGYYPAYYLNIDAIRVGDMYEYPPTYPLPRLHPFWKLRR